MSGPIGYAGGTDLSRILVVDDAAFARVRTSRTLVGAGHEVLEAENGAQAVEVYERERPDAVLLDITMPVMDGLEALTAIRTFDPTARIAMLTAVGHEAVVLDAIRRGAIDFLVKPATPDRLLAVVRRLLDH
jgi:two-component system, chemotaxis family, chemotaxis protein CheY